MSNKLVNPFDAYREPCETNPIGANSQINSMIHIMVMCILYLLWISINTNRNVVAIQKIWQQQQQQLHMESSHQLEQYEKVRSKLEMLYGELTERASDAGFIQENL